MKAKHAPGPWEPESEATVAKRMGTYIVDVYSDAAKVGDKLPAQAIGSTLAVAMANARLIAAAPELLEACELLLHVCEGEQEDEAFDGVRAVIAKAKGVA